MNTIWYLSILLLVPVLVHLFSFRKAKKVYFSNLKLIAKSSVSTRSKSRLKHLIILSTRLILILFLLLLLFDSFVTTDLRKIDINDAFLDHSQSMHIEFDGASSIDNAQNILESSDYEIITSNTLNLDHSMVISDFQGVTVEYLRDYLSDSSFQRTFLFTTDLNRVFNVYIDSVYINVKPTDQSLNELMIFPVLSGSERVSNLVFRLVHADKQISSFILDSNKIEPIVFDVPRNLQGEFFIVIEGDDVLFDNEFRLVLNQRDVMEIGLIDESGSTYLENVFGNKSLFAIHRLNLEAMDFDILQKCDFLIVNGVNQLPSGFVNQVEDKKVLFAPTARGGVDFDTELMSLHVKLLNDSNRYHLRLDEGNPIFSDISEKNLSLSDMPSARKFYQLDGDYEVLIELRTGDPFLVKKLDKNFYFLNSPLELEFTDFTTHSIFLPILYKLALNTDEGLNQLHFFPDEYTYIDGSRGKKSPRIVGNNIDVIPEFNSTENGLIVKIPRIEAGFYMLIHEADTAKIAINVSKDESLMEALTIEDMRENFGDLSHVRIQTINEAIDTQGEKTISIVKYILILIGLALLTETIIHRYLK